MCSTEHLIKIAGCLIRRLINQRKEARTRDLHFWFTVTLTSDSPNHNSFGVIPASFCPQQHVYRALSQPEWGVPARAAHAHPTCLTSPNSFTLAPRPLMIMNCVCAHVCMCKYEKRVPVEARCRCWVCLCSNTFTLLLEPWSLIGAY